MAIKYNRERIERHLLFLCPPPPPPPEESQSLSEFQLEPTEAEEVSNNDDRFMTMWLQQQNQHQQQQMIQNQIKQKKETKLQHQPQQYEQQSHQQHEHQQESHRTKIDPTTTTALNVDPNIPS